MRSLKQILQGWLGIQELSDSVAILKHHEEWRQFDSLGGIVDDTTNTATYDNLRRGSYPMHGVTELTPGDIIEPEIHPQMVEVVKGYARPQ